MGSKTGRRAATQSFRRFTGQTFFQQPLARLCPKVWIIDALHKLMVARAGCIKRAGPRSPNPCVGGPISPANGSFRPRADGWLARYRSPNRRAADIHRRRIPEAVKRRLAIDCDRASSEAPKLEI